VTTLFLAFLCAILLHLSAIAAMAHVAGVGIRTFSFGAGPRLVAVGRFRIGAVPLGGYVRFVDSREGPVAADELRSAFDHQPAATQLGIILSGCLALVVAAVAVEGDAVLRAFAVAPLQFLGGAVSPLGKAQVLLADVSRFSRDASWTTLFGVAAAKLAAINLLPFPALNGGAAVGVVARVAGWARHWPAELTQVQLFGFLAALTSWCVAIAVFAMA